MEKEQEKRFELFEVRADSIPCHSLVAIPSLDETIQRMKTEILDDVRSGSVPKDVKSFSELHDYVDANCYGGFCEDSLLSSMIEHFGGRNEVRPQAALGTQEARSAGVPVGNEGMPDDMMQYLNGAQDAIHQWIIDGGIAARLDQSGSQRPSLLKVRGS